MLLTTTWLDQLTFRNAFVGRLFQHLLTLLNTWVKVTMWSAEFFSIAITLVMFIWTEWTEWIPLPHARSRSTPFSDRLYHFHVTISRCCKDLSTVSFLAQLDSGYLCLQNAFHELNGLSPRVNEHILFLGSFWTAYPFAFHLFCLMVAFQPSMDRNPITKKKTLKN